MSDIVNQELPLALQMADEGLIPVLRSALYPGASSESIKLVLGYCRAAGLDPMQKPVHLVPMRVKKVGGGRDDYEWRDVVMPGIGLYRTQAARTGALAGIDEPVFGESEPMPGRPGKAVPRSCRLTVYRMIGGQRVAFTAVEFWAENYATAGKDTDAPNAMWTRRPFGQLAKCAEAQALRKAFPELGSQPTADETIIDAVDGVAEGTAALTAASMPGTRDVVRRKAKPAAPTQPVLVGTSFDPGPRWSIPSPPPPVAAIAAVMLPSEIDVPPIGPAEALPKAPAGRPEDPAALPVALVGEGEIAYLKNKAASIGIDLTDVLLDAGGLVLDRLTRADFAAVKHILRSRE